jgi:tRNA pseudouridine55 synthase
VALTGFAAVELDGEAGQKFCGGQAVQVAAGQENGLVRVYVAAGRFLGVGELSDDGRLAPRRVFNLNEETP